MNLNADDIIDDFAHNNGKIYLNNASVSLMPNQSIEAMRDFLAEYSGVGPDSPAAEDLVEEKFRAVRSAVSRIIGSRPDEVAVTQSVTDGINMVANGLSMDQDAEIIVRGMTHEHHANLYPWMRMARKKSGLRSMPVDENGVFETGDLRRLVGPQTGLVTLSHALYNTGAIMPVEQAGDILAERQIPYFVDAAQTVGCIDAVDVGRLKCDFMAFNGSKWLCGPMGTGIFYCRRGSAPMLEPADIGGESAVLCDDGMLAYKDPPDRFQTGFRNYAGLAGLESSANYLLGLGLSNIRRKVIRLANLLREELGKIPGVVLYGPSSEDQRTSIVSFTVGGGRGTGAEQVVKRLERDGVILAVREIMEHKIVRASPHLFNSEQDMLRVAKLVGGFMTRPAPL